MHTYDDIELLFLLSVVGAFVWVVASYWTKRRLLGRAPAAIAPDPSEKVLKPVLEENRQLRALVVRLENRIQVRETIATDPSQRTAREIEQLR